jgi:hypothetical protein
MTGKHRAFRQHHRESQVHSNRVSCKLVAKIVNPHCPPEVCSYEGPYLPNKHITPWCVSSCLSWELNVGNSLEILIVKLRR